MFNYYANGLTSEFIVQIQQAQNNQFNMHVHVEYEWRLRQDDWYESDDDLEDKVSLYVIRKSMLVENRLGVIAVVQDNYMPCFQQ